MAEELTGQAKLFDALTTKGTAFTHDERHRYGLLGLLPTAEKTLAQQVEHSWHEFSTRRNDLDKHIYLRALQDRNETLFYRLLHDHIPETMPHRLHPDGRRGAASASARSTDGRADSSCPIPTATACARCSATVRTATRT